jgi:ribonuclease HI
MYYLFSDGACQPNPGQGGWAYIIRNGPHVYAKSSGFEPNTTNNRMELRAVKEGLTHLKLVCPKGTDLMLISDSKYLIDSVDTWIHGWLKRGWKTADNKPVKNKDLLESILELRSHFSMKCQHVYGHSGHPENEECDHMAVREIKEHLHERQS